MLTLSTLKQYLQAKHAATLAEISLSFAEEASVVECMLMHFIKRGQVKCIRKTVHCGTTCHQCAFATTDVYEWQDQAAHSF